MTIPVDINTTNSKKEGSTLKQWLFAIIANMTLFSYGLQCGWISCSTKVLQSDESPIGRPMTDAEISWLASVPSFAATISVSVYSILVDKYGRKPCIILNALFQLIAWVIKLCPSNVISLMVARICCGIAGGGCFILVPMYVKEISQDDMRGILGMILVMSQNVGILAIYAIGGYLRYHTVLWIVVGIPLVNIILFWKAPESPSFLVKFGKTDEATSTIANLRGRTVDDKVVKNEIDAIKAEEDRFKTLPSITYVEIFKHKPWRKGFIFMILLMICHSLNGAFSIVSYAATILTKVGVTISPELQSLSIPTFMVVGTVTSMVCVERLGRKPILATAFIMSVIYFSSLAAILMVQQHSYSVAGWLPVLAIVVSVTAYAAAVAPMPSLIMSETFNFQIRAKVMGVLLTLGWMFGFVQLFVFHSISNNFGDHMIFVCFAIVNLCGALVTVILLPETKGKSVEQIELELERRLKKKKNLP